MNKLDLAYLQILSETLKGNIDVALELKEDAESLNEEGYSFSEGYEEKYPYVQEAVETLLGSYDFTRCVRPDGSVYGTAGTCRKGTQIADLEKKIARQESFLRSASPSKYSKRELDIERGELQKMKSQLAGMKSTKRQKSTKSEDAPEPVKKSRVRTAGRRMADMNTEERMAALDKKYRSRVKELKKMTDLEVKQLYVEKVRNGRWPTRPSSFPGKQTMAQSIAGEELEKDRKLVRKRANQEAGPKGQQATKMAMEIANDAIKTKNTRDLEAAVSLLEGADKITNREIRAGQRRAKQLTDAVQRLGGIEKDLKHRVNKMDMGYAKESPRVRQQLAKIQAAQEKVGKMRDQNLKFRKEVEGPLRDKLKKANESLEALASEIRRQEGPAREMQLSNYKSLVRNVTEIRKRLNEGPGFSPDLGGKGGEPINVSKLYESLKIDL